MAHMIPPEPPAASDGGSKAETLVWNELQKQLDDSFFVYSRFRYVASATAREGESDFLIVHRELGILSLECKGYGVRRTGDGTWIRTFQSQEQRLKMDPFEQAQQQIKTIKAQLDTRLRKQFPKLTQFPFVHGHAVIFPIALRQDINLPMDVAEEIVFDASDLENLGERVKNALQFWRKAAGRPVKPLEDFQFKGFRKKVLHPQLNIAECLGATLIAEERALVQLSEEQANVVDMWLGTPRLRIQGGAGTGKTVLAVEAAKRFAEQGQKAALLCYNKSLSHHLSLAVEDLDSNYPIMATHFHRLCIQAYELTHGGRPTIPPPGKESSHFWEETAPYYVLDALEQGTIEKVDAVIVDEGQDFSALWWDVLEQMLKEPKTGRMLVFFNPSQQIFGRGHHIPEFPTMLMSKNYRNTKRIAKSVSVLGQVDMSSAPRCPEGDDPVVYPLESPSRNKKHLANLLLRLVKDERVLPDQIVILTPHRRENSSLEGADELAGFELAASPSDRPGRILHTTIGAFKGLESDVLIMLDIDPADNLCSRSARYVAASRAKHRLYVYAKGDWLS